MNDTELQERVRQALERTDIMALSTIDEDGGPWTSPVQYQSDSQLNLYFASMPDARHVRNIQRDARAAVAIYHMPGRQAATSASRLAAGHVSPEPGLQNRLVEPAMRHCYFWVPLSGALGGDYGACTNDRSPFDGRVRFEHDGCDEFQSAESWGQADK